MRDYLANYIYDLHLLAEGKPFEDTFLQTNYLSKIHRELQEIVRSAEPVVEQSYEEAKKAEILIISLTSFMLALLLIGLWKYNTSKLEKNYEIFDLLVSINPTLCLRELKKLRSCQRELLHKPNEYLVQGEEAE